MDNVFIATQSKNNIIINIEKVFKDKNTADDFLRYCVSDFNGVVLDDICTENNHTIICKSQCSESMGVIFKYGWNKYRVCDMEEEYCWTIFFDNLLAGVYTDKQKAIEHLDCLIADFPKCVKRKENDWMTVYDDSNGEEGGSFFFMTKRKLNVPLIGHK